MANPYKAKGKVDSGQLKMVNEHLKVEDGYYFRKSCPEIDALESSRGGALAAPLRAKKHSTHFELLTFGEKWAEIRGYSVGMFELSKSEAI